MMSPEHRSLLQAFLGEAAGDSDHAHVVLGLSDAPEHAPALIAAAMQRRLAVVNAHPMARSPEADQVRLLLYSAATELLAGRTMPGAAAPPAKSQAAPSLAPPLSPSFTPTSLPSSVAPSATSMTSRALVNTDPALIEETIRLLSLHGGMTPDAIASLSRFAQSRRLPADAVNAALAAVFYQTEQPAPSPRANPGPAPIGSVPSADLDADAAEDPSQRLVRQAVIFMLSLLGVCVAVVAIAGTMWITSRGGGPAPTTAPPPTTTATATPAPAPPAAPVVTSPTQTPASTVAAQPPPPEPEDLVPPDPAGLVHSLRKTVDLAAGEPEAAALAFGDAARQAARWWPTLDTGQRAAAVEATIEALFRLGATPAGPRALEAITEGAATLAEPSIPLTRGRVNPAAWSLGILVRLSRERELPAALAAPTDQTLNAVLGGERPVVNTSFAAGATLALRLMPIRLVTQAGSPEAASQAFQRWEQAVRAAADGLASATPTAPAQPSAADQAAEQIILEGLQSILVSAPEPDTDRAVFQTITDAAGRLRWRPGEVSRRRLLAWFARPDISASDLHFLTAAIVTKSSAEGVDLTMVLPPSASVEERATLAQAYANIWALRPAKTGIDLQQTWLNAAREHLARADAASTPIDNLRAAAVLARLNESAARRDRGDTQGAVEALGDRLAEALAVSLDLPTGSFALLTSDPVPGDGQWAAGFAGSAKLDDKTSRLRELENSAGPAGPADADVLAEAAITSIHGDLRAVAQSTVIRFADNPHVVNGLLKALPRVTRGPIVHSTITQASQRTLPGWQTEAWAVATRRALVERLIEMVAAGGGRGAALGDVATDRLAAHLADAYAARAGLEVSAGGATPLDAARILSNAAAEYYKQTRLRADRYAPNTLAPWPLDRIDRRHAGRLSLARGPVQAFAADQTSTAEALAYVVSGEQPHRAARVKTEIDRMHAERRAANDLLQQIRVVESTMTRLLLIRAGEETP